MEIKRQSGTLRVGGILYTASPNVRHSRKCADKDKGGSWTQCDCPKSILVYNGTNQEQKRISAHTRSWGEATIQAEEWLDKFDPYKIERKRQEANAATIERAVYSYIQDMIHRLGDNNTVQRARTLFGDVDGEGNIKRKGRLFDWLNTQTPRPLFITDVTAPQLSAWRNGWNYGSDMTAYQSWCDVVIFFNFCVSQGWLVKSPAAELRYPKVKKGNRTATFSDDQYEKILKASRGNQRLHTFLEFLRWSAMSLMDAVEFDRKSLGKDGVLRYTRIKTHTLATVKLPEHVLNLLREVPLNADNTYEQPFKRTGITVKACEWEWRVALQELFKKAGVMKVKTDVRERAPHPHMLRDTCAVWYLRHGMSLYGVSKILGHANTRVTERHYLPFVQEMEAAHIAENKSILEAFKPKHTDAQTDNVIAFAR